MLHFLLLLPRRHPRGSPAPTPCDSTASTSATLRAAQSLSTDATTSSATPSTVCLLIIPLNFSSNPFPDLPVKPYTCRSCNRSFSRSDLYEKYVPIPISLASLLTFLATSSRASTLNGQMVLCLPTLPRRSPPPPLLPPRDPLLAPAHHPLPLPPPPPPESPPSTWRGRAAPRAPVEARRVPSASTATLQAPPQQAPEAAAAAFHPSPMPTRAPLPAPQLQPQPSSPPPPVARVCRSMSSPTLTTNLRCISTLRLFLNTPHTLAPCLSTPLPCPCLLSHTLNSLHRSSCPLPCRNCLSRPLHPKCINRQCLGIHSLHPPSLVAEAAAAPATRAAPAEAAARAEVAAAAAAAQSTRQTIWNSTPSTTSAAIHFPTNLLSHTRPSTTCPP